MDEERKAKTSYIPRQLRQDNENRRISGQDWPNTLHFCNERLDFCLNGLLAFSLERRSSPNMTTVIMADCRVQLIIIIAFLYLIWGISGTLSRHNPQSPAATAALRSVAPGLLVVEAGTAHVPAKNEQNLPAAHAPFFFQAIPVNSADKEMLMTVQGIGPALADAIISFRQQHGSLQNIDELAKIPGVGAKRAAALAPFLRLGEGQ